MDLRERPGGPFRRHPWETERARFVGELVRRHLAGAAPARILDVGAGDGWLAHELARRTPGLGGIVCWDPGYAGGLPADLPAEPAESVRFTSERPRERFGLLLLLDVLEHLEDDRGFLGALVRDNLAPRGRALVSVPAWPWLFGRHDRALGHWRRYSPGSCRGLLREAGLAVLESGGLFASGLALRLPGRILEGMRGPLPPPAPSPLQWRHGEASARLVERLLRIDAWASRTASRARLELPGLSYWAVCARSR
jgi:hypothetical protein